MTKNVNSQVHDSIMKHIHLESLQQKNLNLGWELGFKKQQSFLDKFGNPQIPYNFNLVICKDSTDGLCPK